MIDIEYLANVYSLVMEDLKEAKNIDDDIDDIKDKINDAINHLKNLEDFFY